MSQTQVLTKHGYDFYEVASAFQKAIRRGDEDNALFWGIELYETNYKSYVWKRMVIMCSEDVGLGEPSCIVQVMALKQSFDFLFQLKDYGAMKLPFIQAILVLVKSRKSRYVDHAITVYWDKIEKEKRAFNDYVFDNHTRRGKAMGRDLKFFYNESCKITNANKLQGEEELEKEAWKVDNVYGIQRDDEPVNDTTFNSAKKKQDDCPTLF